MQKSLQGGRGIDAADDPPLGVGVLHGLLTLQGGRGIDAADDPSDGSGAAPQY